MNKQTQSPSYRLILKQFAIQSVLFVGLFVILLSFQNCAGEMAADNSDLSSLGTSLPFAYDSKVDHVGYMSCSIMPAGFDTNAFFTFKVGAYETSGGLRISDAARAQTSKLTPALVAETLALSPINAGVLQQISVRSNANLQQYFTVVGGSNVGNFATSLSDTNITTVLAGLAAGARANNFPGLPAAIQKYEGKVFFTASEVGAQDVRSALQTGTGVLGITYNQPATGAATAMGATANSASSVYGSGLTIAFKQAAGTGLGNPARTLSTVSERDLSSGAATAGNWDCNANYVFKVVRFADLGSRIICGALNMTGEPNLAGLTAAQIDSYNVMRKVLPAEYWALDVVNKCAVLRS
ncbi:MAG: hypothetical protein AABZ31_00740, partial [Bdellovibrionota bacterium]